jgi:hypothetical protein
LSTRAIRAALLLLAVLVSAPSGAAEEFTFLFPPDLTLVTGERVRIYAFTPDNALSVPVRVNGLVSGTLGGKFFLKAEVPLNRGMNVVRAGASVVRIYRDPDAKGDELSVPGRPEGETLVFRTVRLHPALDDGCEGCHSVDDGKLSWKSGKEGCYACHENFEKNEAGGGIHVHTPMSLRGECTGCHDPHFSKAPKLRKE